MAEIKKITISRAGGYTFYYYLDKDGEAWFNFRDKHSVMMMAQKELGGVLLEYVRKAAEAEFRARTWNYKTWREVLQEQREVFSSVSKRIYKDLQANLQLS